MFYTSTRNNEIRVTASQAIAQGISEEGGLFVPCEIPHFDLDNMVHEYKDALDITPDEYNGAWNDETKSFEKLKNLKEYYNKVKGIQVKI